MEIRLSFQLGKYLAQLNILPSSSKPLLPPGACAAQPPSRLALTPTPTPTPSRPAVSPNHPLLTR